MLVVQIGLIQASVIECCLRRIYDTESICAICDKDDVTVARAAAERRLKETELLFDRYFYLNSSVGSTLLSLIGAGLRLSAVVLPILTRLLSPSARTNLCYRLESANQTRYLRLSEALSDIGFPIDSGHLRRLATSCHKNKKIWEK